ncbi:MAG: hypothetical protein FWC41_00435 [Firmicutes bacterium]|nr:hypothetical protein [Bacillota bacterium]
MKFYAITKKTNMLCKNAPCDELHIFNSRENRNSFVSGYDSIAEVTKNNDLRISEIIKQSDDNYFTTRVHYWS